MVREIDHVVIKMHSYSHSHSHSNNNHSSRYSAKKMAKPINFICVAPAAKHVTLVGDFNDWNPTAYPMKRQPDGAWLVQVALNHGHHHYQFLVDGKPTLDPRAQGVARNEQGEKVSLLAVS
jgi:1,4-alpha-glucan branching enzyme